MKIQDDLARLVQGVIEDLGMTETEVVVERPADEKHGEFSTNVAMVMFSRLKAKSQNQISGENLSNDVTRAKNPFELAQYISNRINENLPRYLIKCEVAGPGFINFFVSEHYLLSVLDRVFQLDSGIRNIKNNNRIKTIIEYSDPNPFKEFHIGHLYSNIVGESLARLFEFVGKDVRRVCYQGDVGMHVSKTLWGVNEEILRLSGSSHLARSTQDDKLDLKSLSSLSNIKLFMETLGQNPLKERIEFLGQAYARGATAYEEDEAAKREMQRINELVYYVAQKRLVDEENWTAQVKYVNVTEIDPERLRVVEELYRVGRAWSLDYFEEIYRRLGTNNSKVDGKVFENYYFESVVGEYGFKYVMVGLARGIFEKGEGGAVVFPGEKYGLHTRVFINAKGLPTYEAKDLGLAPTKYKDWAYDESVIVTGNEIDEYFQVVLKAMEQLEPELRAKTKHISHGMVRLPEGKMSSRTGKILKGEWLLDEARDEAKKIMREIKDKRGGSDGEEKSGFQDDKLETRNSRLENSNPESIYSKSVEIDLEKIAEQVGQAAVKFALLSSNVGRDVTFNFEESVSFEGRSGPYVQYSYARAVSILRKAQNERSSELDVLSQIEKALKDVKWGELEAELNNEERAVLRWLERFDEIVEKAVREYAPHLVAGYVYELAQRFNGFYNRHAVLEKKNSEVLENNQPHISDVETTPDRQAISNPKFPSFVTTTSDRLPNQTISDSAVSAGKQFLYQSQNANLQPLTVDFQHPRSCFRIALTTATAKVLKQGLGLLGIEALERM